MIKDNIQKIYRLSPMQSDMYYHYLNNSNTDIYINQAYYKIKGELDINRIKKAFSELVDRHDTLRTIFMQRKGEVLQVVQIKGKIDFYYGDLSNQDSPDDEFNSIKRRNQNKGMDLKRGPLLKFSVFRLKRNIYALLLEYHHIILDGWSAAILLKDLITIYSGNAFALARPCQYSEYVKWLEKKEPADSMNFWNEYLQNIDESANGFALLKNTINGGDWAGRIDSYKIDAHKTNLLRELAAEHSVTLNTLITTLWGITAAKINDTRDVTFGAVVSGRNNKIANIETMCGLLINTVPLRVHYDKDDTFGALVKRQQEAYFSIDSHSYDNLARIQSKAGKVLVEYIFVYENYPSVFSSSSGQAFDMEMLESDMTERGSYPLTILAIPNQQFELRFLHNTNVYTEDNISLMQRCFGNLIDVVLSGNELTIEAMPIVSRQEIEEQIDIYRSNIHEPDEWRTIIDIIKCAAVKNPGRKAVFDDDGMLTYAELDDFSDRLARHISALTSGKKENIGIMMDRSVAMIASIVGVMKAGCVYVPVEVSLPEHRARYMMEDCGASILLARGAYCERARGLCDIIVDVNDIPDGLNLPNSDFKLPGLEDIAYIIYTSGSTGNPKGVAVCHHALVNRIRWQNRRFPIDEQDVMMQKTSSSFDVSILEYFYMLYGESALYMLKQGLEKDVKRILEKIRISGTTIIHFVPSMFQAFLDFLVANRQYIPYAEGLKYVYTSGEPLLPTHVELFYMLFGHTQAILVNQYGPTEATVDVAYHICAERTPEIVPIGKAIDNAGLFVVNKQFIPQPNGVPGELCIVGLPLGRGYINNEKQTREKFIPCPFIKNAIMYRTGDLAKVLPDESLLYLGRIDRQVKIRGFRIELSEIENAMLCIDDITNVIVMAVKDKENNDILVAYYCTNKKEESNYRQRADKDYGFRMFLKERLPEYMVPSLFIELDEIPVLTNGKADKGKLSDPYVYMRQAAASDHNMDDIERRISLVWSDVLAIDADMIGRNSDFMLLGGHSITAIRVAYLLNAEFKVELSPVDIFKYSPLSELAFHIQRARHSESLHEIPRVPKKDGYNVTFAQSRLYTLEHLFDMGLGYNIVNSYRIYGDLNLDRIATAWKELSTRHEVLRARFEMWDGKILQYIEDDVQFEIVYDEIDAINANERMQSLIKPLPLDNAPLYKLYLFKMGDGQWLFTIQIHHIIADGLSISLLMREFYQLYLGKGLPAMELSFLDYTEWQSSESYKERINAQKAYWTGLFEEECPLLNLETDYARPSVQSYEGDQIEYTIDEKMGRSIEQFCRSNDLTANSFLLSALFILLYKHTNAKDIVIGVPVSGRNFKGSEQLVGMFVNTVCVRGHIVPENTFTDFALATHSRMIDAVSNQDYPFEKLISDLKLEKDTSHNPLFIVSFTYRSYDSSDVMQSEALTIEPYMYNKKSSIFDISMEAIAAEEGNIKIVLQFRTDLFQRQSIKRMLGHYETIILNGIQNSGSSLNDIDFVTDAEKEWLAELYTPVSGERQKMTIHEMFNHQAGLRPNETAICYKEQRLSYNWLNDRSERIACCLQANGLKKGNIVVLLLNRSANMIAAILGVIKAGGAYLPIDRSSPDERKVFIMSDSGASHVLYENAADIKRADGVVWIKIQQACVFQGNRDEVNVSLNDYAYIIYTSGTTGKPKGIPISHANVMSLMFPPKQLFKFSHHDVWTMYHSYSFDFSVWEIYGALLYGGTLVVVDDSVVKNPHELRKLLIKERVSILNMTPTAFYQLSNIEMQYAKEEMSIRYIIFGGEALNLTQLLDWHSRYSNVEFINMYGITETTVHVTYKKIDKSDMIRGISNVGKAIPTLRAYIMDESRRLLPPGIVGEICVEGDGVSDGYLFRQELTNERFIDHPLFTRSKLFCSGDLGKLLDNGDICYIGRKDTQVKIRGYRVELGEIENRLLMIESIDEAVVLTAKDSLGNVNIWAFYTGNEEKQSADIRGILQLYLPAYMIPFRFIYINAVPLTQNGKVDYAVLEDATHLHLAEDEIAADLDEGLLGVLLHHCGHILHNDTLQPEDDFFDIGGDSIKVIQLSNLMKKFGYTLDVQSIFQHPVLKNMAQHINLLESDNNDEEAAGSVLTPIQRWFYSRGDKNIHFYNQSIIIASHDRLDISIMKRALHKIFTYHEVLRVLYARDNDDIVPVADCQPIDKLFGIRELDVEHAQGVSITELSAQAKHGLNLFTGPIVNMLILHTKDHDKLFITIHHLYVDGVSWNILLEDLAVAYQSESRNENIALTGKTASYALWSRELAKYSRGELIKGQIDMWKEMLSAESLFQEINPDVRIYETIKTIESTLDKRDTDHLSFSLSREYGASVAGVLLAALAKTITDMCEKSQATVYVEGHGRLSGVQNVQITRTIGWFTAIYPVKLAGNFANLVELLSHTMRVLQSIPHGGVDYGALKYLSSSDPFIGSREHRDILFNYSGRMQYRRNQMEVEIFELDDIEYADPQNRFLYAIEMNSCIKNDELVIRTSYSVKQFDEDWMCRFVLLYMQNIKELIDVCTDDQHVSYKNRIVLETIQPYNDIFFIDCFYNMLFSLLSGYDLLVTPFFANYLWSYETQDGSIINLYTISQVPLEELLDDIGLNVLILDRCTDIVASVRETLLEGRTCLVQIDAYYQPMRKDTYETEHWPHALAVYGFNDDSEIFYVIEHNEKNSLTFAPMTISYEALRSCYEGYLEHFNTNGMPTVMSLCKKDDVPAYDAHKWRNRFINGFSANAEKIINSIEQSRQLLDMTSDTDVNVNQLTHNLNKIINANLFLSHQNELFLDGVYTSDLEIIRKMWLKARLLLERVAIRKRWEAAAWLEIKNIVAEAMTLEKCCMTKIISKLT